MSGHGASVSSESSDKQRIPCKNKINKTLYTSINGREIIQEPYNPSKRRKQYSIPDVEKYNPKKAPPSFKNKEDYIGDTNGKTRGSDDSPIETDDYVMKMGEEH